MRTVSGFRSSVLVSAIGRLDLSSLFRGVLDLSGVQNLNSGVCVG
jgi:hypothetical protein